MGVASLLEPQPVALHKLQLRQSVSGLAAFQLARDAGYHVSMHTTQASRFGPPYKRRRAPLVVRARNGPGVREALAQMALDYPREELPPHVLLTPAQLLGLRHSCFWSAPRARESIQLYSAAKNYPSAQARMLSCHQPPHLPLADEGRVDDWTVLTSADKVRLMGLRYVRVPPSLPKAVWAQALLRHCGARRRRRPGPGLLRQPTLAAAARAGMPPNAAALLDAPPPPLPPGTGMVNGIYVSSAMDAAAELGSNDGELSDGDDGNARVAPATARAAAAVAGANAAAAAASASAAAAVRQHRHGAGASGRARPGSLRSHDGPSGRGRHPGGSRGRVVYAGVFAHCSGCSQLCTGGFAHCSGCHDFCARDDDTTTCAHFSCGDEDCSTCNRDIGRGVLPSAVLQERELRQRAAPCRCAAADAQSAAAAATPTDSDSDSSSAGTKRSMTMTAAWAVAEAWLLAQSGIVGSDSETDTAELSDDDTAKYDAAHPLGNVAAVLYSIILRPSTFSAASAVNIAASASGSIAQVQVRAQACVPAGLFVADGAHSLDARHGASVGSSLGYNESALQVYTLPLLVPADGLRMHKGETVAYLRRFDTEEANRLHERGGVARNFLRFQRRRRRHRAHLVDDDDTAGNSSDASSERRRRHAPARHATHARAQRSPPPAPLRLAALSVPLAGPRRRRRQRTVARQQRRRRHHPCTRRGRRRRRRQARR